MYLCEMFQKDHIIYLTAKLTLGLHVNLTVKYTGTVYGVISIKKIHPEN